MLIFGQQINLTWLKDQRITSSFLKGLKEASTKFFKLKKLLCTTPTTITRISHWLRIVLTRSSDGPKLIYEPSASLNVPDIPTEIFERIIELCSPQHDIAGHSRFARSTEVLLACSLTCKAWVYRSQFMLFSNVFLETQASVESFINVIQENPRVRTYVRSLTIHGTPGMASHRQPRLGSTLTLLARKLNNLEYINFTLLPIYVHSSLSTVVSQYVMVTHLTLRGAVLDNRRDLIKFVMSFPNLHHLNVRYIIFSGKNLKEGDVTSAALRKHRSTRPSLISLAIDFVRSIDDAMRGIDTQHPLLNWIINSPPLTQIQRLWLTVVWPSFESPKKVSENAATAGRLIRYCAAALQVLVLDFDDLSLNSLEISNDEDQILWNEDELSLRDATSLHHLYILNLRPVSLKSATRLLSSLPSEKITHISLQIQIRNVLEIVDDDYTGSDTDKWSLLDIALSKQDFKALRVVRIDVHRDEIRLPAEARRRLPRTESRGVLEVVSDETEVDRRFIEEMFASD